MRKPVDWRGRRAPGLDEIEALARRVFQDLNEDFRSACGAVVIQVSDFPSEEVLREMNVESEFDLLGLFQGIGQAQQGDVVSGELPNMIWLYRRPILDYWAAYDEMLGSIIAHVLIHEIGHHLGFSDEDMERIEAAYEAP